MIITGYEALCNLGNGIDAIYQKAINGDVTCFEMLDGYFNDAQVRAGLIKTDLPEIKETDFNIRCNKLILKNLELLGSSLNKFLEKYPKDEIAIVAATTNSGVEEFELSNSTKHCELGNPARFLSTHLGLNGYYITVSTACSSGLKAFSIARDLMKNKVAKAVIVVCVDPLSKVPLYGFKALEVLTENPSNSFGKNREGMNMGEACAIFTVEDDKEVENGSGIKIMGLGESSDIYHSTTPDPEGKEAINAINLALKDAKISPKDIDYINAHGTGTMANDIMEAQAINEVFGEKIPVSSTKPMTGHCLGAAAGIEVALCCKLLDNFDGKLYPHVYDGNYDENLSKIELVKKDFKYEKCKICMCNSFGFGGTNAIMILGKSENQPPKDNKEYLETILPHKRPMLLIDDIADYSPENKYIKSVVTIREDALFYDKTIKGIDSIMGIEYMAQTVGCYAFLRKGLSEPQIGFLLGSRLYNCKTDKFELGKTYYILAKEVFGAEIYSFECFIYDEAHSDLNSDLNSGINLGEEGWLASATVNVYQDENIEAVFNGR